MPIYEYDCPACGTAFEELVHSARDAQRVACPKCGGHKATRRPSVFAPHSAPARRESLPAACSQCNNPNGPCPLAP